MTQRPPLAEARSATTPLARRRRWRIALAAGFYTLRIEHADEGPDTRSSATAQTEPQSLRRRMLAALAVSVCVVSTAEIAGQFPAIYGKAAIGLRGVARAVSALQIYNAFSRTVAQLERRHSELGADRGE